MARDVAMGSSADPLLSVRGLQVWFEALKIIDDVSFSMTPGERVALVGESGCGKSVTGLALQRLLPPFAKISGSTLFEGRDINALSPAALRDIRGREIGMIFQEPMSALDPVFTIGEQLSEVLKVHTSLRRPERKEAVLHALDDVGISDPARRYNEYPHQLSGGMRQRAMIAMALICDPKLLIADEPTTALDVTIQAQILELVLRLSEQRGTALLLITHDLGLVAEVCSRMITMYAGQIVEDGPIGDVLDHPRHPYTSGLLKALPEGGFPRGQLPFIPGRVPLPANMPAGCRFQERCGFAAAGCGEQQRLVPIGPERLVRCQRQSELVLEGAA